MDIAAFISETLEHENDLIVPGLGMFYRSRVEGYYSKELHQFYPPTLQLLFNAEVTEDDGKMVSLLMADQHISASTARSYVAEFVAQLLMQANKENVAIGDLGTFSSRRNALVFAARRLTNNNEVFYGLVPVKLKRSGLVIEKPAEAKPDLYIPVTETPTPFTAALLRGEPMPAAKAPVEETVVYDDTEEAPKKSNAWILIIALLLLAAGLSLLGAYKYRPDLFSKYIGGNVQPPSTDLAIRRHKSDSVKAMIQAQKDIGLNMKVDSATKSQIESRVDTFAIVIATIENYSSASRELDRYSNKGYNVELRKAPRGSKYMIDIATFFNADSAKRNLQVYKDKLRDNTFFVQKFPYQAK